MYFPITLINIIIKYSIFKLYRNKIKKSNILRMLNIIMPFYWNMHIYLIHLSVE